MRRRCSPARLRDSPIWLPCACLTVHAAAAALRPRRLAALCLCLPTRPLQASKQAASSKQALCPAKLQSTVDYARRVGGAYHRAKWRLASEGFTCAFCFPLCLPHFLARRIPATIPAPFNNTSAKAQGLLTGEAGQNPPPAAQPQARVGAIRAQVPLPSCSLFLRVSERGQGTPK
jgi:hypothetical protein